MKKIYLKLELLALFGLQGARCGILSLNQILAEPLILLMGSYKMHFVYISFKKKKKTNKKVSKICRVEVKADIVHRI